MKLKKVNLEWYAFRMDNGELTQFNVLSEELKERIAKLYRNKKLNSLATLKELVNSELMYYYWSKCECEVGVIGLFENNIENAIKIDVYYQLKPNLDRIVEYINNTMELKLK